MNIFKTMAVQGIEDATRAIAVIDFGPAFSGEPGGLDAVARTVLLPPESGRRHRVPAELRGSR